MTNSRTAAFFVALALLWGSCGNADARKAGMSSTRIKEQVLSLDFTNNGQHVAATVGQWIEITLGTIGPKYYGDPQVSSPALRLGGVALVKPTNPGGAAFIYMFDAAREGEVQVKFPLVSENPDLVKQLTFTVTIHIGSGTGKLTALDASMTPDQANTAPWKNAWTNMNNSVRQTFKPSLPTLTGVEVELVVANPGPASGEVTMAVLRRTSDRSEDTLAEVTKTVPVADCGHVLFHLPNGGLRVSPGQVYSIALSSVGSVFGWKYVVGGYANGTATANGFDAKPLSRNTRSTFLFRTFGEN